MSFEINAPAPVMDYFPSCSPTTASFSSTTPDSSPESSSMGASHSPKPEVSTLILTTEGKVALEGNTSVTVVGMPSSSLISEVKESSEATKAPGTENGQAILLKEAKSKEEIKGWAERFDAAQPTGQSLSAKSDEFKILLRSFREEQKKNLKEAKESEAAVTPEEKETKRKIGIFKRVLMKFT